MEFDLIELLRSRAPLRRADVVLGIGDDAALLELPAGMQLVACTDTLVAGVHFPAGTDPADLGWKSLAVNLSDLAAMGAEPAWALLALTLPDADPSFVDAFAAGFAALAARHGVELVGGDTTQGPLSVTVTALGSVPRGQALTRRGAAAGDAVFVTGSLGDAAGALRWLRGQARRSFESLRRGKGEEASHPLPQEAASAKRGREVAPGAVEGGPSAGRDAVAPLLARLHRPEPRLAAGQALRGLASACIDVSDGLLADLGHVCRQSGVGCTIEAEALPVSPALRAGFDAAASRGLALAGGDDYELCFTAPMPRESEVVAALAHTGCRATRIGRVTAGPGIRVLDASGQALETPRAGWEHFSPEGSA